tara:strand:- start:1315 stop:1998 length:684 start_codon:yes stop_codon:yes gene_type:complete
MDPMGFYSGTQRTLTLGFRVISENIPEARTNMDLIQKLVQYQYPAFQPRGSVATLKSPPYFNIEIMNVASDSRSKALQGYLTSGIRVNPGFQDKNTAQYFNDDYSQILFSDVNISFQMTVLHASNVGFYGKRGGDGAEEFASGPAYPYNVGGKTSSATTNPTVPPPATTTANAAKAPSSVSKGSRAAPRSLTANLDQLLSTRQAGSSYGVDIDAVLQALPTSRKWEW